MGEIIVTRPDANGLLANMAMMPKNYLDVQKISKFFNNSPFLLDSYCVSDRTDYFFGWFSRSCRQSCW